MLHRRADWERDGHDWPNRRASRFVRAGGLRWHVQVMGDGPVVLLLHGTGSATHSWRALAPMLAEGFTVVAPDLPGHGFTDPIPGNRQTLPGLARAIGDLLRVLDVVPVLAVGHSAGAAVAIRMTLDGLATPRTLVSLNGALLPLRGVPGRVFSPIAKLLALNPLVPSLFAWRACDRRVVERLIRDTGSAIDPVGLELYVRMIRTPGHAAAALAMMANWDLHGLERILPRLATRLLLVVGGNDRTIPPTDARRVQALLPAAEVIELPGLGHLAHEEDPAAVAVILRAAVRPDACHRRPGSCTVNKC